MTGAPPAAIVGRSRLNLATGVATLAFVVGACAKANTADDDGDDGVDIDAEVKIDAPPPADADPSQPDADTTPDASPPDAAPGSPDAAPDAMVPSGNPDTCAQALDLTAGAMMPGGIDVTGDNTGYANDTQPATSCTGYDPDGPDAIYTVTVSAGQTITATVTPTAWDASIFISSNCTLAAMCLDGADVSAGSGAETAMFTVGSAGTYYVVVESWQLGVEGPYTLNVRVQ
jgi:hypothetical protein